MDKERQFCADICQEYKNCFYAKVVEEHGEYPVLTFRATVKKGVPDLSTMQDVKARVDTTCLCVYCTHPSHLKEKFIGSVEPYFACLVPSDCPEMQKQCETTANKKPTIFEKIKNLLKK